MSLPRIDSVQVRGKNTLVYADLFDDSSPLCNYGIDDTVSQVQMLVDRGAKVSVVSCLAENDLHSVAERIAGELEDTSVEYSESAVPDFKAPVTIHKSLLNHEPEQKADKDYAHKVAKHTDLFVNNALIASSLKTAILSRLPALTESYAGASLYSRVEWLNSLLGGQKRPVVLILGGIEAGKKLAVFKKLLNVIDGLIAGGTVGLTLLKGKAVETGESIVDQESTVEGFQLLQKADLEETEVVLPVDHLVAEQIARKTKTKNSAIGVPPGMMAVDTGTKSASEFARFLKQAGMVVMHGPMGAVEIEKFQDGTKQIFKALSKLKCTVLLIGEDTCSMAIAQKFPARFMIPDGKVFFQFMQENTLPGLTALEKSAE